VETEDCHVTVHKATGADIEVHSEAGGMIAAPVTTSRTEGIRAPTEDAQPHPADNTAAGTLEYSELLGIMKQIQERTTTQATLAHEQSEKVENKLSEMTKKLDKVTHVMEEQQFKFTYSNKAGNYALTATRRI